jgi:uncharacterized protein with FMN-binding domain
MARPKGKLFALLAVFAAIGLVAASGAFTSVEAERTVSVTTSGDASAALQLEVEDSVYASTDNNELEIDVSDANQDATTELDSVFRITNDGSQEVGVYISSTSGDVDYYWGDEPTNSSEGDTRDVTLGSGDSITVGIQLNFDGVTSSPSVNDITINADASEVGDGDGADGEGT